MLHVWHTVNWKHFICDVGDLEPVAMCWLRTGRRLIVLRRNARLSLITLRQSGDVHSIVGLSTQTARDMHNTVELGSEVQLQPYDIQWDSLTERLMVMFRCSSRAATAESSPDQKQTQTPARKRSTSGASDTELSLADLLATPRLPTAAVVTYQVTERDSLTMLCR